MPPLTLPNPSTEPETDTTAVIYLRVSSQGQVNKAHDPLGYSIPGQQQACERYAASLNARVIRTYVEPGRSATSTNRKALQQLLAELPSLSPTYVVFYDLSRVARDEPDAFSLLKTITNAGARLVSTREPVDNSPQGLLLFAIMAGVNAFRSRDDGQKVKMGVARKHAEGGSHGPARLGYLNSRENVDGREVAVVTVDEHRAPLIRLAFEAYATGEHTLTTLTEFLDAAGLRTRPTRTRPEREVSRASLARILRDDYYLGIVSLNGAKQQGRHDALVDSGTFEQVQHVLDGHRTSGERSHKHSHHLSGSLYCTCGVRLGYGRHRGKTGAVYEYFSCLSRVRPGGRCPAPYISVDDAEAAIAALYKREPLTLDEIDEVKHDLIAYVKEKAGIATREAERHHRRVGELSREQQKLLQLFYKGKLDEDVFEAEKARIAGERTQAERWTAAAKAETEDVTAALEEALCLLDRAHVDYAQQPPNVKRLVNQAIYDKLIVEGPDEIDVEHTPFYADAIRYARRPKSVARPAAKTSATRNRAVPQSKKNPDPLFRGRGSHIDRMAERAGFEPAMEFDPHTRLAGECLQPLGHLSHGDSQSRGWGAGSRRARTPTREEQRGRPPLRGTVVRRRGEHVPVRAPSREGPAEAPAPALFYGEPGT
jgi:site-specific DNA recombinase